MRCPFCRYPDSRVIDSREVDDGQAIRRRRSCPECSRRFTTVEEALLVVAKRSGVTEPFSRAKVVDGVRRACQGRPVDEDALAKLAQQVEEAVRGSGQAEVPSQEIGLAILGPLRELDEVAYLRFASVYRSFTSADDFAAEIRDMRAAATPPDPVDPSAASARSAGHPPQRRQASTTRRSTSADRPRACHRRSVWADRIPVRSGTGQSPAAGPPHVTYSVTQRQRCQRSSRAAGGVPPRGRNCKDMTDTVGATETSTESTASSNGQTKNRKARATQQGDRSNGSRGLHLERLYTTAGVHPYDEVSWQRRDVVMTNWRDGSINFEQRGVEFPDFWSINATNIVTSKYFRGAVGTPTRESSLRQIIDRVVGTYTAAGVEHGYFATAEDEEIFAHELTWMLLHQVFAFNSPVWFNVGTASPQQVSACFILSVDDTMDSILNWYREEGLIFKGGSGAGLNLSRIRSSKELLSSGGTASGPVSFMRGADASAGTIKSGGATRRAAKMVVLDVDHPDIAEFVETKAKEENKIRVLRDAGFDMDLGGEDIISVQYQNANNSVRVSDEFMRAVESTRQRVPRSACAPGRPARSSKPSRPVSFSARSRRPRGRAPTPASSTTTPSTTGTPARSRAGSTRRTRAASTCTWTTRPATWRR